MSLGRLTAGALRLLPAEAAHDAALAALEAADAAPWLQRAAPADPSSLGVSVAGLDLPNPIGLAAGFDKDARACRSLLRLGFGFVECGTVTPLPQPGSPKPRLFRLTGDRAIINRMGFNSGGLEAFAARLKGRDVRAAGVVGANLGANKDAADRIADYEAGLRRVWGLVDYVTINISSPNTPGLRDLQQASALEELLGRLAVVRAALTSDAAGPPVFLKVAPDIAPADIDTIIAAARSHGVDALIVSNTTIARPPELTSPQRDEMGGLSGRPLFARSTELVAAFYRASEGRLPIIAAGGVDSGAAAYAKIRAGATVVQLYSGLIFEGPGLVVRVKRDLAARLHADGFDTITKAIGADVSL